MSLLTLTRCRAARGGPGPGRPAALALGVRCRRLVRAARGQHTGLLLADDIYSISRLLRSHVVGALSRIIADAEQPVNLAVPDVPGPPWPGPEREISSRQAWSSQQASSARRVGRMADRAWAQWYWVRGRPAVRRGRGYRRRRVAGGVGRTAVRTPERLSRASLEGGGRPRAKRASPKQAVCSECTSL